MATSINWTPGSGPGPGPWTLDQDPGPRPWTLPLDPEPKNLDPGKPGINIGLRNMSDFR